MMSSARPQSPSLAAMLDEHALDHLENLPEYSDEASQSHDLEIVVAICTGKPALAMSVLEQALAKSPPEKISDRVLVCAADRGCADLVRRLVDVCGPGALDNLALRRASSSGHLEVVKILATLCDVDAGELCLAAAEGHIDVVKFLLPISRPGASRVSALVAAARNGRTEVVRLLIPHTDMTIAGQSAMQEAVAWGHPEAVKLLIDNPECAAHAQEAMNLAAEVGRIDIVRILIPFVDLKASPVPLCNAAAAGKAGLIELMRTPSVLNPSAVTIFDAPFPSESADELEIVRLLIPLSNPTDKDSAALRVAALTGRLNTLELLLPVSGDLQRLLEKYAKNFAPEAAALIQARLDDQELSAIPDKGDQPPSPVPRLPM